MRVILASASPRRRELFARVTDAFDVRPAEIDETRRAGEAPDAYARRIANEKAIRASRAEPGAIVLAADTIVCLGDAVLGKPADDRAAAAMLEQLSGRTHRVLTAVAGARHGAVEALELVASDVSFRTLSGAEIERYVATGEPRDKAGAYAIQGGAGAFITGVAGSVTNVIGLPLAETESIARRLGVPPVRAGSAEAIALRYRSLAAEVAAIAVAAGRSSADVRLVAVSKGHPAEAAVAAVAAGATILGENYVQEGAAKRAAVAAAGAGADLEWHLIGRLQRNKAGSAARTFDLVHTIDRVETARALVGRASGPVEVLVQVNVADDPAKAGVAPEDLEALLGELRSLPGLVVGGLMTIGAVEATREQARAAFAALRDLLERARARDLVAGARLSMGMSGDYDVAIAEGATLVRVGTAIFGPRQVREEAGREPR